MVYISQKVLVLDNEETGEIENFKLLGFDPFRMDMNYSNEFVIIDLVSGVPKNVFSETFLFPKSKKLPLPIPSGMGHLAALDKLNEWDFDVAFGNFEKLPNSKGFCRLIRGATLGEDKKNPEIFIEVFDNDFMKIGEANLTEIQSDLSTFFFAVGDMLFFKAKEQENENYLNYYLVEIGF